VSAQSAESSARRPLDDEIEVQVDKLERVVLLATSAAALGGSLLTASLALTVDVRLGGGLSLMLVGVAIWFFLMRVLLGLGIASHAIRRLDPIVESMVPSLMLLVEAYALPHPLMQLTSSAPLVYGLICVLSVLRLRSRLPMLVGVLGGLQYLAIIQFVIVPRLPLALIASGELSLGLIYVQPLVIMMIGFTGSLVSVALRNAVRRAHGELRARDLFGKYQIGDRIAAGGMGVVFRARYQPEGGFRRDVAIKVIHDRLALEQSFVDSFRAEAELAARLTHPNVVQVHDFGKINDTYFVAMEYVDGWTLAGIQQRCLAANRPLPPPLLALILRDICLALQFAHAEVRGDDGQLLRVVHRDLSPSNVLVTRSGMAKITDFGVAKVLGAKAFTQATTLTGKLAYMAPEQAAGGAVDERADLFCVGIICWELLTGQPLFRKPTDAATLSAVLNQPLVPPSQLRVGLAPHWDQFVVRALQRSADQRFGSAAQMVAAIDGLLAAEGVPAPGELAQWLASLNAPAATEASAIPVRADAGSDATLIDQREIQARQGRVKG